MDLRWHGMHSYLLGTLFSRYPPAQSRLVCVIQGFKLLKLEGTQSFLLKQTQSEVSSLFPESS